MTPIATVPMSVPSSAPATQRRLGPESISSRQLFGAARALLIQHAGQVYRLQITRNNRLILTK